MLWKQLQCLSNLCWISPERCFSWSLQFLNFWCVSVGTGRAHMFVITCISVHRSCLLRQWSPACSTQKQSWTWCMILQAKSTSRRSCKPGCRALQTFVHHCAERSLWELPADLLPFTVTWDKRCCLYSHRDLQLILPRNGAFFLF